jgi:PEP-CTERM motif
MTAYHIRPLGRLAFGVALGLGTSAFAASFNGFDNNASATPPLLLHPISDGARDAFIAAAGGVSAIRLNDFEALTAGTVPASLDFGSGLQASFTALATNGTALTAGNGAFFEFPISGTKHITSVTLQGTTYWTMTFNQPLTAVGFYATDMSDWSGFAGTIPPLQVVLTGNGGAVTYDLTPGINPTTVANASVAFFGVVDAANPFTQLTLAHPAHVLTEDAVGIDNLMAVPVPEPETWMAMLAGLGLLGWRLRNHTRG